jgi:hypothetical protein
MCYNHHNLEKVRTNCSYDLWIFNKSIHQSKLAPIVNIWIQIINVVMIQWYPVLCWLWKVHIVFSQHTSLKQPRTIFFPHSVRRNQHKRCNVISFGTMQNSSSELRKNWSYILVCTLFHVRKEQFFPLWKKNPITVWTCIFLLEMKFPSSSEISLWTPLSTLENICKFL